MIDFITKFFRREESSKSMAKERLRLVLMSDRVSLAPETFNAMKGEMLGVLQRYLEIDEHGLDVHFENAERRFMLLANIPVTQVKTHEQIELERRRLAVNGSDTSEARPPARRRRRRRRAAAASTENAATAEGAEAASTEPSADAEPRAPHNGAAGNGMMNGYHAPDAEPESKPDAPNGNEN